MVEKAREALGSALDIIDKQLQDTPYLAGSTFTLADAAYMPELEYLVVGEGGVVVVVVVVVVIGAMCNSSHGDDDGIGGFITFKPSPD